MSRLGGGSPEHPKKYIGKTIRSAAFDESRLILGFTDGTVIKLWDNGQSCCESRYMTTDDDVATLVGGTLLSIEEKDGDWKGIDNERYFDRHDVVFVEIQTDKGFITIVNHNEHNGYYGGFGLSIAEMEVR